jgi:hypothetical protein
MSCVCGHAPEEHRHEIRECKAEFIDDSDPENRYPCQCAMYEEDDEADA